MIVSVMYMFCPNYLFIAHVIHVLCASNSFASSLCEECGRGLYERGINCNVCAIFFLFLGYTASTTMVMDELF